MIITKKLFLITDLAAIALFSNFKLTTSSGKHLENIDHAHIVSLKYKLLKLSGGSDDLPIGLDRDRIRRKREMTNNKNIKGKYHIRIYLNDIFGFTEHQEKATYGLGYELTLLRATDNAVLNKTNATAIVKIRLHSIEWYVPHYTASVEEQKKSCIIESDYGKDTHRVSICKDICFHERSGHTESLVF